VAVCCVVLISAGELQTVMFIANCVSCENWVAVNLTGLLYIVSMK